MKKVIKSLCYLSLIAGLMFVTSCSDDDDDDKVLIVDFNGKLAEAESEYVGPKEGELPPNVYYYESTFTDPSNFVTFTHYANAHGDYFGGGFTYTNKEAHKENPTYTNSGAITGKGVTGSTYLVANTASYYPAVITLKESTTLKGAYFTNNTYAYMAMKDGNDHSTVFVEDDYFTLVIIGKLADSKTAEVKLELGKGRNFLDTWKWVDLTSLGKIDEINFDFESNKTNASGITVPSYFCMDGLTINL